MKKLLISIKLLFICLVFSYGQLAHPCDSWLGLTGEDPVFSKSENGCSVNAGPDQTFCLNDVLESGFQLNGTVNPTGEYKHIWCVTYPIGAPSLIFNRFEYSTFVFGSFVEGTYTFTLYVACGEDGATVADQVQITIIDPQINITTDANLNTSDNIYYGCSSANFSATNDENLPGFWSIDPASDEDFSYTVSGNSISINSDLEHSVCGKIIKLNYTVYGPNNCIVTRQVSLKFCAANTSLNNTASTPHIINICIDDLCSSGDNCPHVDNSYTFDATDLPFGGCGRNTTFAITAPQGTPNPGVIITYYPNSTTIKSVKILNLCSGVSYKAKYSSVGPSSTCPCPAVIRYFRLNTQESDLCYNPGPSQCFLYCDQSPTSISFNLPPLTNASINWSVNTFGQGTFGMYFTNPNSVNTSLQNIPDNIHFNVNANISSPGGCSLPFIAATIWPEQNIQAVAPFHLSCDQPIDYFFFRNHLSSSYLSPSGEWINENSSPNTPISLNLIESPTGFSLPPGLANPFNFTPDVFFVPYLPGKYIFEIIASVNACGSSCSETAYLEFTVGPGSQPVNAGETYFSCSQSCIQLNGNSVGAGSYTYQWSILPSGPEFDDPNSEDPFVCNLVEGVVYTLTYEVCSIDNCCSTDQTTIETKDCGDCSPFEFVCYEDGYYCIDVVGGNHAAQPPCGCRVDWASADGTIQYSYLECLPLGAFPPNSEVFVHVYDCSGDPNINVTFPIIINCPEMKSRKAATKYNVQDQNDINLFTNFLDRKNTHTIRNISLSRLHVELININEKIISNAIIDPGESYNIKGSYPSGIYLLRIKNLNSNKIKYHKIIIH